MLTVLLVLQVIITVSMIIVILIQRNSSDGMAGLAGSGNSIMSGRASANLLTRITSVLAAAFIINSLVMAAVTSRSSSSEKSIVDEIKIDQKAVAPLTGDAVKDDKENLEKESLIENKAGSAKTEDKKPEAPAKEESKPVVPIAK